MLHGAATLAAEHAQPVRLVDDQPGAVRVAEVGELGQRRGRPGHRVHAVDTTTAAACGSSRSNCAASEPTSLCRNRIAVPALAAAPPCALACAWASTSSASSGPHTVDSSARLALMPDEVSTAASAP